MISDNFLAALDRFVEAKTIAKVMEEEAKGVEKQLKEDFFNEFCDILWSKKAMPINPRITTFIGESPNHSAIFQMRKIFRPVLPPSKNRAADKSPKDYIISSIEKVGFPRKAAKDIVDKNIVVEKVYTVQYNAPKSVLDKFFNILYAKSKKILGELGVFSDEERNDLFGEPKEVVRVIEPDKFFLRAVSVSDNIETMKGLIKVFNPEIVISNLVFAQSAKMGDTPKLDAAKKIIGEH